MKQQVTILSIESSCDETGAAVLTGTLGSKSPQFKLLSNVVKSQIPLHKKMGGVVPEVAARAHVQNILPVTQKALTDARVSLNPQPKTRKPFIDLIAVTTGPGLIASLIVGTEFAKGLALGTEKKMVAVNHMEGHLYSPFGEEFPISNSQFLNKSKAKNSKSKIEFPLISLVVSGGHTMLVLMKSEREYTVIGSTVDDAAGEAFDKVAKLLKLPYPGGPVISTLAEKGRPSIKFPRPMLNTKNYDFSFSGLKTAVLYYLQSLHPLPPTRYPTRDIARSFEEAVVDVLVTKTLRAAQEHKARTVTLAGGVAANSRLRKTLQAKCQMLNITCLIAPPKLCTDNAGMIAIAAYFKLRAGYKPKNYSSLKADSTWELQ